MRNYSVGLNSSLTKYCVLHFSLLQLINTIFVLRVLFIGENTIFDGDSFLYRIDISLTVALVQYVDYKKYRRIVLMLLKCLC